MTVQLSPEDEELIRKRLQGGAFRNAGEVIHDALATQDAEEDWLAQNKGVVHERIARGLAQLDRGEGASGEVARARLRRHKAKWLSDPKAR